MSTAPKDAQAPAGGEGAAGAWDDMVLVGFIARTHGNKGEVILNSETDFADQRFRVGATVFARQGGAAAQPLAITSVRFQQGRPILGIAGIRSIDDAERLAGAELRVPASAQETLPAGTYYHHELIGADVRTVADESVGTVTAVEGSGHATRLVVRGRRGEILIPLAQDICRIDVAARRIVVTPPEGLLELNGDWR